MGFKKCPICELNYIPEEEKCCDVCKRAQHGGDNDEVAMCIECGENPAVRGRELCIACLREARRQEKLQKATESLIETDLDVGELDDMEVPISDGDIPESEMEEIHRELGVESENEEMDEDIDEDMDEEMDEDMDEDMDEEADEDVLGSDFGGGKSIRE